MQKLLLSCVLALACTGCSGFAHLTHQLVVHAPELLGAGWPTQGRLDWTW